MNNVVNTVARLIDVDPVKAANTIRRHPVFGDEIHIEEELINLREAMQHYIAVSQTVKKYPKLERHMKSEVRAIFTHCIGMVQRMLKKQSLPQTYTEEDTRHAIKEMCRVLVDAGQASGRLRLCNRRIIALLEPYMTLGQRSKLYEHRFAPYAYAKAVMRRPAYGK